MWLYVPNISISSPSALEEPALISASSWQFQALERSVWWRGKPFQSRHLFQRWNKVSFIRLLCGAMPEPSMAAHGVAQWTASLAASRASPTASPDESREATTPETSGRRRAASSSSRAHGSSLSRTSAGCSRGGLTKSLARSVYSETFQSLVLRLREDCSRRQKSARAIRASESSSLAWPTASARDWKGANQKELHDRGCKGAPLNEIAVLWYTPNVPNGGRTLSESTSSTGMTADGVKRQVGLENQARWWATPRVTVNRTSTIAMVRPDSGSSLSLEQQAEILAGITPIEVARSEKLLKRFGLSSPQVQTAETTGESSSTDRRSLNPLFVEWLMGWPPGWTLAAWTDFACSETALSLFKQHMRSALLSLGFPREAPPAQFALFD